MSPRELRRKYLEFFESKGHQRYPSGSLIPYDVTGKLDDSLLFNGAGMVQFKPFFRGVASPPNRRLTNCQKCVRTGDIEDVGDLSHLTFFEMLGNFSFGDYFKAEAIAYSWEFLTDPKWLGLDPKRLSFTVFEEDDEAYELWSKCVAGAGLKPESRIMRLGEDTNYWPAGAFSAGPPGPCGPNTEMFYWTAQTPPPGDDYTREQWLADDAAKNWLEIWNDVFIQYEWQGQLRNPDRPSDGYQKTGMPELPFRSIDTGMGLDRTAAVLGGFNSVYDTDSFRPILGVIDAICDAAGTGRPYGADESLDRAKRIIADHIRTACFCIADGILPGNNGRGYVLRRLIRRAVLKGARVLGLQDPFFHLVFAGVVEAMGDHYTELLERQETILETLRNEEFLFRRTLDSGTETLAFQLQPWIRGDRPVTEQFPGDIAFRLYDTYGFPLEVTQEICGEAGVMVDVEGYDQALKEAQERSRGASAMGTVYGGDKDAHQFTTTPTEFLGYNEAHVQARIVGALPEVGEDGLGTGYIAFALDRTPFYAESGGQVADTGTIWCDAFRLRVTNVIKQNGVFVHEAIAESSEHPTNFKGTSKEELERWLLEHLFNQTVEAEVDIARRLRIQRNHTGTHLLHAALRTILGKHVTQAGSLVSPDHLRFDFTHGSALSDEELESVERLCNDWALGGSPVLIYENLPIAQAKEMGAMALFGEKYGEFVRMVEIGDFSRELCGGTHTRTAAEVGLFKIVHESSAASGVRRIEAVTGEGAYEYLSQQLNILSDASALIKTNPKELTNTLEKLLEQLREERRKREKLAQQGAGAPEMATQRLGAIELAIQTLEDVEPKDAQAVADRLVDGHPDRVIVIALRAEGKLTFVCKAGPVAVQHGAHAGNIVREIAKIAGGGGGGRPDFATAGGRIPEKMDEALAAVPGLLGAVLN